MTQYLQVCVCVCVCVTSFQRTLGKLLLIGWKNCQKNWGDWCCSSTDFIGQVLWKIYPLLQWNKSYLRSVGLQNLRILEEGTKLRKIRSEKGWGTAITLESVLLTLKPDWVSLYQQYSVCNKNSHLWRGRRENALALCCFKRPKRHLIRWLILLCHEKLSYKEKKNLTMFLIVKWPILISCLMNYLHTPPKAIYTQSTLRRCSRLHVLIYRRLLLWIQYILFIYSESGDVLHLRQQWRSSYDTSALLWSQSNGWSEFLQGCHYSVNENRQKG